LIVFAIYLKSFDYLEKLEIKRVFYLIAIMRLRGGARWGVYPDKQIVLTKEIT
jgi:hypothetical protein